MRMATGEGMRRSKTIHILLLPIGMDTILPDSCGLNDNIDMTDRLDSNLDPLPKDAEDSC